ncbi:MAG: metal-dependent transcriptional regulator [Planctomycetia bacterium]|nr:metal-dependent transcriptional regulator [Planctomycetia bacterium]
MTIQQSAEDYLEKILIMTHSGMRVKSIDIATEMKFSRASVSSAVKRLREEGMILVDEHGMILLTEAGRKVAEEVYHRHRLLTEFLIAIGVDRETAVEDACRMEHVISQKTSGMLAVHFQRMQRDARRTNRSRKSEPSD